MKIFVTKYLLLFCLSGTGLTAFAAESLSNVISEQDLFVRSEDLLISALRKISNNDIENALQDLRHLIRLKPDFKAAQVIYADMMLSHTQGLTGFGDIPDVSFKRVTALRDEVQARWSYRKSPINKNNVPSSLIQLADRQEYVVVVDSLRSRLFLFKNQQGVPTLVDDFYVTIGKNGMGKLVEGDQKTPVGVYSITGFMKPEALPDLYGDGAFTTNYPNDWDQKRGRTGYGIWLHGTPSKIYSRPPRDSDGCVIVSNDDLNTLISLIDKEDPTPIIISEKIQWITKQEWKQRRANYEAFVEKWRKDWESKNVDLYLSHYSKEYSGLGKDYNSWVEYKRQVNSSKKFIRVNLSNTSIFMYPGEQQLMVVTFVQDYISNNFKRKFTKRQYWRMENDGRWRIIYEGVAS